MTRLDHITYCSVCKNGLKADDGELICGLTYKIADFENKCLSFIIDPLKKENKIKDYRININDSIQRKGEFFYGAFRSDSNLHFLPDISLENNFNQIGDEVVILETRKKKFRLLLLGIIPIAFVAQLAYRDDRDFENYFWVAFMSVMVLASIFSIRHFLINRAIFRMNSLGLITTNGKLIPWNRINYIHFKLIPDSIKWKGMDRELIFCLVIRMHKGFGRDKMIDLGYAQMEINKIGELVHSYIKTFKEN
jgi:hypothetical protein